MPPADDYEAYLARFAAQLGDAAVGTFVKHNGKLIQKLDREGFTKTYREYMDMAGHYLEGLDRGDTVNDVVVKVIRDHAAQLVLTSPV